MSFSEKIDKLLTISGKDLNTVEALEKFAGIGGKTLRKNYNKNTEPSNRILKQLLTAFTLDPEAWRLGQVKKSEENGTSVSKEGGALTPEVLRHWQTALEWKEKFVNEREKLAEEKAKTARLTQQLLECQAKSK